MAWALRLVERVMKEYPKAFRVVSADGLYLRSDFFNNEGGFNELVNVWHGDHLYKHGTNAILAFWLIVLLAFNLFHAFVNRNLKAVRRIGHTAKYFLGLIAAEFHLPIGKSRAPVPS